jgi:hypothetical protein
MKVANRNLTDHSSIFALKASRPTIKRSSFLIIPKITATSQATPPQQSLWAKRSFLMAAASAVSIGLAAFAGFKHFTPPPPSPETVTTLFGWTRHYHLMLVPALSITADAARIISSMRSHSSQESTNCQPCSASLPRQARQDLKFSDLYTVRIIGGCYRLARAALRAIFADCSPLPAPNNTGGASNYVPRRRMRGAPPPAFRNPLPGEPGYNADGIYPAPL